MSQQRSVYFPSRKEKGISQAEKKRVYRCVNQCITYSQLVLTIRAKPSILLMPVGEIHSKEVRIDLKEARRNLEKRSLSLIIMEPLYDELKIIEASRKLKSMKIDVLVLLALHGASAPLLVLATEIAELPSIIWALPSRFSLPSSASAIGALKDRNKRADLVYGSPSEEAAGRQIELNARIAFAINRLRRARIGVIGGIFDLMTASYYDRNILKQKLGPDIVRITVSDFKKAISEIEPTQVDKAIGELPDKIEVQVDEDIFRSAMTQHLALRKIADTRGLEAMVVECHSELIREFAINPCLGFIKNDYLIGCEGDVVNTVALLMIKYLTGTYGLIADPFSIDGEGLMTMVHCAGPAEWGEIVSVLEGTSPSHVGKPIPLAMCRPKLRTPLDVTLIRLYGSHLDNLHLATGRILSSETEKQLKFKVKLLEGRESFIKNISGNHYIIVAGDVRQEVRLVCEALGIQVVENHN